MKNNIFGYLFFIFIIIIMGFAIYRVNTSNNGENSNNTDVQAGTTSLEKGKTLTLAISGYDTINPIITKNKNVQDIAKLIYEPLVNVTEDGKTEPCLAQEWETTDNKTYIIKLKTGIKWTDGTFFSSNDVKYTIDRLKSKEAKGLAYTYNVQHLQEVDIIDNTTIKIILSKKIPFYEYFLTFPILSSNYYQNGNFWDIDKHNMPISTGRFEIVEEKGNKLILKKNINWWNKENDDSTIDQITINLYSRVVELYNAFKLGSIDLISTTNSDYKNYIGKIGYNVKEIEGRNFSFLALNTKSEFLSDKNVRKAIRSAINKDEIISKIYKKTYTRANFPLINSSYLVDDKNENYFDYSKTENYLKDAGWTLKKGQWQKTINYRTKYLELTLVVKEGTNREKIADFISEKLASQGISIYVKKVSNKDYKKYIDEKNYDIILSEMTESISPSLSTYFNDGNLANFENDEAKNMIKEASNITDKDELKKRYQKLYEIYNDKVPYIGIGRNKVYVITSTYLNGKINSKWYNLFFGFKDWYINK